MTDTMIPGVSCLLPPLSDVQTADRPGFPLLTGAPGPQRDAGQLDTNPTPLLTTEIGKYDTGFFRILVIFLANLQLGAGTRKY